MADVNWSGILDQCLGDFTPEQLPATLSLPALPHAVTLFSQRSSDPDVTIRELAEILETDTGLTLELLKYVNSSFLGLRTKVATVSQALGILGQRQSKAFVISTGMQAAVKARKSKLINQNCFWSASLQKALFAKEVAKLLKTDPDLAFAGALLQDYLLPVVTNDLFEPYLEFSSQRDTQPKSICDFEQKAFGWDHALAGASLARRWHLPDDLVCCILFHHQGLPLLAHPQLGRTAAAAVAVSALLPDQIRQQYDGLEHLVKLQEKWKAFDIEQLAETVDALQAQAGLGMRNDFPLSRRCRPVLDDQSVYNDGTLAVSA